MVQHVGLYLRAFFFSATVSVALIQQTVETHCGMYERAC